MPKKNCEICGGIGWRPVEADGVIRMTKCDCQEMDRAESRLHQARIPPRYQNCAFENYDIRKDHETGLPNQSLVQAKLFAQKFVEEYPTDFGLLFVGPTGVGKTHLAVAVLREMILTKGIECLFYDFRDLLREIRDSYDPVSQTSELRVLQPVLDIEVLLLDGLAASNPSEWVRETLTHVINSRYNQKKATLITTTLSLGKTLGEESKNLFEKSLAQLGGTLQSRLFEMCKLLEMRSDDFRKAVKQAGFRFHHE